MRRIWIAAVVLVFLAACGKSEEKPASEQAAEDATAAEEDGGAEIANPRRTFDRNAAHPELPAHQKIGGTEGRSPFEGDRVTTLNAIVKRSLDASKLYDRNIRGIRADVDKAVATKDPEDRAVAEEGLKKVDAWYADVKAAFDDMEKAEADIKASGEYYDEGIFAAMAKFVTEIEREMREEKATLSAKLAA